MTERSRYAVPLTALVGGAYVPVAEQVELVDETHADWVPDAQFPVLPMGVDGAGPDGD